MMKVGLTTLCGIIHSEATVRQILKHGGYINCDELKKRSEELTREQWGELCIALNALKDHVRALSLSELEVK